MNIGGLILPGVCLAVYAMTPAWGQSRPNGFFLTSPLRLTWGYDDNFVANNLQLDDTETLLTGPTFDWSASTHRTTFFIDYRPEVEVFTRHSELNTWNHSSNMRFTRQINSRWTLGAGNSFLSTTDSTAELQNSLVLLPLGRFLQNTFYTDLRYRIDHATKLTFRVDNAVTTMDLPGTLRGRLDEVAVAGTVTLDRDLTSRQTLSGSYSFLHVDPLSAQAGSSTNVNLLIAAYSYQLTPSLLVRAAAGGISGSESAFNGSLALEKQWRGLWLAAGYQRYLGFFGGLGPLQLPAVDSTPFAIGVNSNSMYQVISLRANGQLTRRVSLEGIAERGLNNIDSRGLGVRSMIGQLRLSYKINEHVSWFVRAEHYGQNINLFSPLPLSRNRYLAGVEIVLSRPPEVAKRDRRGAPQDSDDAKQIDRQSTVEKF